MTANNIATYPQSGGLTLIQKIVATSESSVTFPNIPQSFNNLRLVCSFSIVSGANLAIQFNGSAANYGYALTFADGNAPVTIGESSQTKAFIAGSAGSSIVDIPNYTSSTLSGVLGVGNFGQYSGGNIFGGSLMAANSVITDITSITLADSGGTALFSAGSIFELYGY